MKKNHEIDEDIFVKEDAKTEAKIGKGMKEAGKLGLIILGYVVLFATSLGLMKVNFKIGVVLVIIVLLVGVIALGIYVERNAKKKLKDQSD